VNSPTSTISYVVGAMSCGHCVAAVTEEVMAVPGVVDVSIDLDTKLVVVDGSGLVDSEIRKAIVEAGFEADA
jgi:copper chaperone